MDYINYEDRIVAFIDILGFSEIVKESITNKDLLDKIYFSLFMLKLNENPKNWNSSMLELEEDFQKKDKSKFEINDNLKCTQFSDCITFSVKYNDDNFHEVFSSFLSRICLIGSQLLYFGVVFRGGISIGKLHHSSENVIIGPALVDAYNIESKIAKSPRIILSKSLIQKLNYPIKTTDDRYPYHGYIKRFEDGLVGSTQLSALEVLQKHIGEYLINIKKEIINGLDDNIDNPSVFEKYKWLMNEYNNLNIIDNENFKKIHALNKNMTNKNIHYSETDKINNK